MRGLLRNERGDINIGGILLMGIGMVFLAVGFIVYPIIMTATDALLAYSYSEVTTNASGCVTFTCTVATANYTGFSQVVGITPLLVLIGYLSAGVFTMYLGVKVAKGGGGTTLNLGTLILLSLSLIFIAIALIIMPVALDGIASVLCEDLSDYTGLSPILFMTPLLILISFIGGAVVSGFFGIKRLGSGS